MCEFDKVRNNGYVDLNKLITNNQARIIEEELDYTKIKIIDKEYYFKRTTCELNEVLAYYIAKDLNIKSAYYDYAILDKFKGVISESVINKNASYITGQYLLKKYYEDHFKDIEDMGFDKEKLKENYRGILSQRLLDKYIEDYSLSAQNNLEIIWQAIDYYLKDMQIDTTFLMHDIALMYIFTLLTHEHDKNAEDWAIEIINNEAKLIPMIDNQYCFNTIDNIDLAMNTQLREKELTWKDSLKSFLSLSSSEYIDLFMEKYNILYADGFLDKMFSKVEKQIKVEIPNYQKLEIKEVYNYLREEIIKVIDDYNPTKTRQ